VTFKDVESDVEMSAYATPGLHGAVILAVHQWVSWYHAGLRENTAIIAVNGEPLDNAEQLMTIFEALKSGDRLLLTVRGVQNDESVICLTHD